MFNLIPRNDARVGITNLVAVLLLITLSASAEEWLAPIKVDGDNREYVGWITVERDRLFDVRAKEFNGNYFLSEKADGGKRIPLYADWYDRLSKLVGRKAKIIGKLREMKSGNQIQIDVLEDLKVEKAEETVDQWHIVGQCDMAKVEAERILYEREGDPYFYVRVRVTNMTDRKIGVALDDYWKVVHANQVGFQDEKERLTIDERHTNYVPLTESDKAKFSLDFKGGKMTSIPAQQTADYYRDFNSAQGFALAKKEEGKFFLISLDGMLSITDGSDSEQVSCGWDLKDTKRKDMADTNLLIPTPIKWQKVSKEARIVLQK